MDEFIGVGTKGMDLSVPYSYSPESLHCQGGAQQLVDRLTYPVEVNQPLFLAILVPCGMMAGSAEDSALAPAWRQQLVGWGIALLIVVWID